MKKGIVGVMAIGAFVGMLACSGGSGGGGGTEDGGSRSDASSSSSGGGSSSDSGANGGTAIVSCYRAGSLCTAVPVPTANESAYENACSNQGGTPGTACPTMGLVGCCKLPGNEECYYGGGGDASQLQMECLMNSGATWSTSP